MVIKTLKATKWAFRLIPKRDEAGKWKQSVPPSSADSPLADRLFGRPVSIYCFEVLRVLYYSTEYFVLFLITSKLLETTLDGFLAAKFGTVKNLVRT